MGRIKVNTDGIRNIQMQIQQQNQKIQKIAQTASQAAANLDMQIAASGDIKQRLTAVCKKCNLRQEQLTSMDTVLNKVVDEFLRTENNIAQQIKELNYLMKYIGMVNLGLAETSASACAGMAASLNSCFGITEDGYADIELSMNAIQKYINAQAMVDGKVSAEGEALYNYLQSHDCTQLFGQYNFSFTFLNDLTYWDTFLYSSQNWKNALASIFCGGGLTDKTYEMFTTNPDECKALLRNMIDDLCKTDYLDVFSKDETAALGAIENLAKNAGLSDTTALIGEVNKFVDNVETADKILKDYSSNVAMLESLKDLAPGSSILSDTVDSLILEYENQAAASLFDELKKEAEKGVVGLADAALGSNILAVDKVLQKVLNEVPQVDSINTLIYTTNLSGDAVRTFWRAADAIQSGSFTESDITAYKNAFNLVKALKIEEYNGMLKYYDTGSREAQYLSDQISQLENMTYNNFNYATDYADFKISAASSGGGGGGGGGFR